jgi:hypothetical protein
MDQHTPFFGEREVIRELCKARVKLASGRHEKQFLQNIRPGDDHPPTAPKGWGDITLDIFPPRRQWHSFRLRHRRREGVPLPSSDVNADTLLLAVIALMQRNPTAAWVLRLKAVIANILKRAFDNPQFAFTTPVIVPAEKNPQRHEYRPLAQYPLEDKIIDCLVARYLRETLDSALTESCLAFRCRTNDRPPPTIHDALAKLLRLNRRHRKTGLYVAECDIKGFYDCVSHDVAQSAIDQLIVEVTRASPSLEIHPRAMTIFQAYLASYAFSEDVDKGQGAARLEARDPKGRYPWPKLELVELHGNGALCRVGVPQGGALSCLIANAVLHKADIALRRLARVRRRRISYLRYCDDMILLCRDKVLCEEAFALYHSVVKGLRLPIHDPKPLPPHHHKDKRRTFYGQKSNEPYLWHNPEMGGHAWIQFVGYQIRHDGLVRIRKKSVLKEINKLRAAVEEVIHRLSESGTNPIRCTAQQITYRFRMKLISMAVGRASLGYVVSPELPMCWAHGFRGLRHCRFIDSTLKELDRYRERQVAILKARMKSLPLPEKPTTDVDGHRVLPYYGRPFSYWGQFRR